MRLFDIDGNGYLDFKEFLMAIDIASCQTEESKLAWVFKLYDVDNNGVIDVNEMARMMETLESLEHKGVVTKGSFKTENAEDLENIAMSARERAQNLFSALDFDGDGLLTMEEFIAGYMERSVLQAKQDAQEQRQHMDWLSIRGPRVSYDQEKIVGDHEEPFFNTKQSRLMASLITKATDVDVDARNGDIAFIGIQKLNENHPQSLLVRFKSAEFRDEVWKRRRQAKKNGLIIEEWLTEHRARLYKKCKELKAAKLIKDVFTKDGDVFAVPKPKDLKSDGEELTEMLILSDSDYEGLIKATRRSSDPEKSEADY